MTDEDYMLIALQQAQLALQENEVPIGAVVVFRDQVIGLGHNTRENDQLATSHAEINAINQACQYLNSWRLEGCSLYATCEPCLMCFGTISQARISKVVYGCPDLKQGACGSMCDCLALENLANKPEIIKGICEKQCKELLQNFFKKMRNR